MTTKHKTSECIVEFESILKDYASWLPEKVCYSCEKSEQLIEFEEGDTGWWCPDCESGEVYYVRDSFVDELKECQKGTNEEIDEALASQKLQWQEKIEKMKMPSWKDWIKDTKAYGGTREEWENLTDAKRNDVLDDVLALLEETE